MNPLDFRRGMHRCWSCRIQLREPGLCPPCSVYEELVELIAELAPLIRARGTVAAMCAASAMEYLARPEVRAVALRPRDSKGF